MRLRGLSAVRLVRTPSLFTLIMSCAPCIQRSAFRSIGTREICKQTSVDQDSFLIYRWYAFGKTESREIGQNALLCIYNNVLRFIHIFPWVLNFPPCRGPGGSIPTGNVATAW